MHAPITSSPEQPGLFENAEMFGNRGQRHRMRAGKVGNASVTPRQVRQNLPARRISQRGKSSVQPSRRMLNHLVKYLAEPLQRSNIFLLQFAEAVRPPRSHGMNASLFTTYGIFVASPP